MRSGFTLIEVLITVTIVTAVSAVGYVAFSKFKGSQAVELTMNEVVAVVKDVQKRSVTQEDGKQWGIRFSNSSSTYEVWSGPSYASGTVSRTYYLGRNTLFGNPATSTIDGVFSAISGKLAETRVISLINRRKDGVVGNIILTSRGAITTRKENGVVGYWHLDENTATTAYDASGFTNTGTLTNGPTWQSASNCKAGACLSFDGTDDYMQVADNDALDVTTLFTYVAWIKRVETGTLVDIIEKNSSAFNDAGTPTWYFDTDNKVKFVVQNVAIIGGTNTAITDTTQWHHLAVTRDSSNTWKFYIDGVLDNTIVNSNAPSANAHPLRIATAPHASRYSQFIIDEVRIYNRALSATEILDIYNGLK